MLHVNLEFTQDVDDSYEPLSENGIELAHLPRVGECLKINSYYHRVIDVVYFDNNESPLLCLGQSSEEPKYAEGWSVNLSEHCLDQLRS